MSFSWLFSNLVIGITQNPHSFAITSLKWLLVNKKMLHAFLFEVIKNKFSISSFASSILMKLLWHIMNWKKIFGSIVFLSLFFFISWICYFSFLDESALWFEFWLPISRSRSLYLSSFFSLACRISISIIGLFSTLSMWSIIYSSS